MTSNTSSEYTTIDNPTSNIDLNTSLTLVGEVTSGMGKAQDFLSLPGYVSQFKARLNFEPYPGTLNVALTGDVDSRIGIDAFDSTSIDSWELDGQTFGGVECYPCRLTTPNNGIYDEAYVLVPERTDHEDNKLELVAPARLRDVLKLDDGDEIRITLSETS